MPDFESIKKEYETLLQQLSDPELISNWEKFEELTNKKNSLEKVIEKGKEIEDIQKKIEENKEILKSKEDPELFSLAENESVQLAEKKIILEKEFNFLEQELKNEPKQEEGNEATASSAVIMEIRAGTGGEEAALFVTDLFKMYSKCAQLQGWEQKVLDSNTTEIGGFKEVIFELKGKGVLTKMLNEAGVHRVQRIPTTEKSGRVHTSTATVAVLIKPKTSELKIRPDELKVETYHSSGPGGQYVNKRMTAVRITHLPSGLVVTSQTERSLLQNKSNALSILEARLLERRESAENEKTGGKRRSQIGTGDRAEKIRTYNFPQDRITDHRIKKSFHNIEKIMAGDLEPIFKYPTRP